MSNKKYHLLALQGIGAAGGDSGRISGTGETPSERSEAAEKLTFFSKYSFSNENKALSIGF